MNQHEKINYIEFPAKNISATKAFFEHVFNWKFEDFGPDYTAFSNQGVDGGFYTSQQASTTKNGASLTVFYSDNLHATQQKVEQAGGQIEQAIFDFPGGSRFHFTEPSGNEFAVWSTTSA
jgi:predicted enzyme related to lactoylglutathione lyase